MPLKGILNPQAVMLDDDSPSKKRLLERAAELLAAGDQTFAESIFERLLERERLGSTGLAGGVALPHARMPGVSEAIGAFIRLGDAIEFDALDGQPVDLVFALMVPEEATEEHLQLLAELARMFNDADTRERLRNGSTEQVLDLLTGQSAHAA